MTMRLFVILFLALFLDGGVFAANVSAAQEAEATKSEVKDRYIGAMEHGAKGRFEEAKAGLAGIASFRFAEEPIGELLEVVNGVIEGREDPGAAIDLFKGILSLEATQFRVGITYIDKAMEGGTLMGLPHYYRGNVHYALEEYGLAMKDLDRAIKVNPALAEAYCKRAAVYYKRGDILKALADSDRALEINDSLAMAYFFKGVAYTKIGRYDDAVSAYDRAISNDPYFVDAYNNRGIIHMVNTGRLDMACADFEKLCELGNCIKLKRLNAAGYCE